MQIQLNPHPGQFRALNSKARIIVVLAGAQGGKTECGAEWLVQEIGRKGGGDYIAASATFPLMESRMIPAFLIRVKDAANLVDMGTWLEAKKQFVFKKNNSRVFFGSATNAQSLESATAKAAWLDEAGQDAFTREAWEAINRRLAIHQGRILITTTLYNFGWLKTDVYDRWVKGDPDIEVIQFDSIMNPLFPPEEYERQRRLLPSWKFAMQFQGRYEKPAGLIYDCYDDATMTIPRRALPAEWPRYVGHDFGMVNTAALFAARDPLTDEMFVYEEYAPTEAHPVQEHVEALKKIAGKDFIWRRFGGSHTETEARQAYSANGWPIAEPAVKDVEAGIEKVYARMKSGKFYIFNTCTRTLDQIHTYSRDVDANYEPVEKIKDKAKYHLADCLRYMLSDFRAERLQFGPSKPVEAVHFVRSHYVKLRKR